MLFAIAKSELSRIIFNAMAKGAEHNISDM